MNQIFEKYKNKIEQVYPEFHPYDNNNKNIQSDNHQLSFSPNPSSNNKPSRENTKSFINFEPAEQPQKKTPSINRAQPKGIKLLKMTLITSSVLLPLIFISLLAEFCVVFITLMPFYFLYAIKARKLLYVEKLVFGLIISDVYSDPNIN